MIDPSPPDSAAPPRLALRGVEIFLITALFFVLAGTPPTEVNEAHYLGKARHYWDPSWCAGDLFLESADAHGAFYWTFGWITQWVSLEASAWVGRFLTWGLLAWSWRRLSWAILPGPLYSVLSAACWTALIQWGHMAGEWVIGGVEAKGFAYVLVLLGLEAVVRGRWRRAVLLGGGATAFHVLVGGWSLVAFAVAWLGTRPAHRTSWVQLFPALVGGGLLAAIGVVPGLALNWGADATTVQSANRIYVFERLAHHLVYHRLPPAYVVRHGALMVLFLGLWWWQRRRSTSAIFASPLPRVVAAAMGMAVVGAILDQALLRQPVLAAAVLRYYWFRLSDVMTPLGVTFAVLAVQQSWSRIRPAWGSWLLVAILIGVSVNAVAVVVQRRQEPRPGAVAQAYPALHLTPGQRLYRWREWLRMCRWIREHTEPDALFLTPRNQQTFKWDAARPEVVNGKDIPQDAAAIVEWRERLEEIFPARVRYTNLVYHGEPHLIELSKKYGFRYIVVDRSVMTRPLRFPLLYPAQATGGFEVYQVPSAE